MAKKATKTKPPKVEKAPKPQKEKKRPARKAEKPDKANKKKAAQGTPETGDALMEAPVKKKKQRGLGGLILILMVLVLLGMTAVCYLYNFFNFKSMVIAFFVAQDDTYQLKAAELALYDEDLTKRYEELDARLLELEQREAAAQAKDAQLTSREERLAAQTETYKSDVAALSTGKMELAQIVETISGMSAKNAAAMMLEFTDMNQITLILSSMEPSDVAKILKAFPADIAASIMELLMYNSGVVERPAPSYYYEDSSGYGVDPDDAGFGYNTPPEETGDGEVPPETESGVTE